MEVRRVALMACAMTWVPLGCADTQRIELQPPDSVVYIGAVALAADGVSELWASPLHRRDEALETAADEVDSVWLFGYDEAALNLLSQNARDLGLDFETLLRSSPLSLSSGCADELPVVTWAARQVRDQSTLEIEPESAPRIRSSWVGSLCEAVSPPSSFDARFSRSWSIEADREDCSTDSLTVEGCALRFDIASCGSARIDPVELVAHPDGRACFSEGSRCVDRSTGADARDGARLEFDCEEPDRSMRRYRLHRHEWTEADLFADVEMVRVLPSAFLQPVEDGLSRHLQFASNVSSILELGDQILVSTHPDEPAGYSCRNETETELVFLDAESLERVHTTTAGPCLTKTLADGSGGFFGVWQAEIGRFVVGHFGADGRLRSERLLHQAAPETLAWNPWVVAFVSVPPELLVVISASYLSESHLQRPGPSDTHLFYLDRGLRILRRVEPPYRNDQLSLSQTQLIQTLSGPRLLYVEDYTDTVALGDDASLGIETSASVSGVFGASVRVGAVAPLSASSLAVSVIGSLSALAEYSFVAGRALELRRVAHFYEFPADVSQIVQHPSGAVYGAARIRSKASSEVAWARLDPSSWRFLPGSMRLLAPDGSEPGAVTNTMVDASGRVWLAFSRSPWVARITSR